MLKSKNAYLFTALLVLTLAGCATGPGESEGPQVGIEAEGPVFISPASSPGTRDALYAELSATAAGEQVLQQYQVVVRNEAQEEIFRLEETVDEAAVPEEPAPVDIPSQISWNGRNNRHNFVPEGRYLLSVRVTDSEGNRARSEPLPIMVDNTAPEASVGLAYNVFSPDGDGSRDTLPIRQNADGAPSWSGEIRRRDGSVVRSWSWEAEVPETLSWDGSTDAGEGVGDGNYRYVLTGVDRAGNRVVAGQRNIEVDTGEYGARLSPSSAAFSPNGDNRRDNITFDPAIPEDADAAEWRFAILNDADETVVSREGVGPLPEEFTFSGNRDGNPLPEGAYRGRLSVVYRNGEGAEATTDPVILDLEAPSASVALSSRQFSPNGDGEQEELRVTLESDGGAQWRAEIYPADGADPAVSRSWSAAPNRFVWNGQTSSGEEAATGMYRLRYGVSDSAGNLTVAESARFLLDREAPSLSVEVTPSPFTPDGDGDNDTLRIATEISDLGSISSWEITIYGPREKPFETISGEGAPPEPITWDGRSSDGELVASGREYTAAVTVIDGAGNESTTESGVSVGILLQEDPAGDLRFRISGIRFAPFEADYLNLEDQELVQQNRRILDRVASLLKEYPEREVLLEGHAVHIFYEDEQLRALEQEETLIPLSRERAEAIRNALVERGVSSDRLAVRGKGGSEPLVPHSDMDDRWRNRRVEFELTNNAGA